MRIAPEPRPVASPEPALLAELAHGQVLEDAVLHVLAGPRGRRRGRPAPRRCPGCPRSGRTTGARSSSRGRCGSSRTRATARTCARDGPARARPPCSTSSGMPRPRSSSGTRSTTSSSPSSPSSLRIALHLLAQQELALALLHALADVGADLVLQLEVGQDVLRPAERTSRGAPRRRASRGSRSSARRRGRASSRTCRRSGRGRRSRAGTRRPAGRRAPRRCSRSRRGTRARAPWRGRSARSPRPVSTWTQTASPVPGTPTPTTARWRPRITSASVPLRSAPTSSIVATVPTRAYRPSARGTSSSRRSTSPEAAAASTAARASSDSIVRVTTMPGRTTPVVSGRSGRA